MSIDPTIKEALRMVQNIFADDSYSGIVANAYIDAEAGRRMAVWADKHGVTRPVAVRRCDICGVQADWESRHEWTLDDWKAEVRGELEK